MSLVAKTPWKASSSHLEKGEIGLPSVFIKARFKAGLNRIPQTTQNRFKPVSQIPGETQGHAKIPRKGQLKRLSW